MCGIFGYVGHRATEGLLLEGLKRLEYRGYDSWGVCLGGDGGLGVRKEAGRLDAIEAADAITTPSWGGIAHTRWATHGPPTRENAHPHLSGNGRVAVVHNGIVENHRALRQRLEQQGRVFQSQTDSEVIAHLVEELLATGSDLTEAVLSACKLLDGTYGIGVVSADHPGVIVAARRGSPMVLGVGDREMLLASDPTALVAFTRNVVYLEDGEAVEIRADSFRTMDLDAQGIDKRVEHIAFDLPAIERGGFDHFMLKEIFEQPESIHDSFRGRLIHGEGTAKLGGVPEELLKRVKRCHILACGTSWHAALVGKYLLEGLARMPTEVSYAAEFRYADPVIEPDTMAIAISQSGETADTLAGIREAMVRGADAVGLVNVVGSTIARECGQGVYIHAGPEIGVASTKAFTSQIVVLLLLAIHLGRMRGLSLGTAIRYLKALEALPDHVREVLDTDAQIRQIAEEFKDVPNALYVGRLYEYPVALEGALKLKEISYIHAEGIPAAELKHGPIALVDSNMPVVVLAAGQRVLDKMLSNIQEIKARGGRIIAVAAEGDQEVPALAEHTIFVPRSMDLVSPILSVVPLQLLAYHVAVARGCDVDRPRNLAKSVTVE